MKKSYLESVIGTLHLGDIYLVLHVIHSDENKFDKV